MSFSLVVLVVLFFSFYDPVVCEFTKYEAALQQTCPGGPIKKLCATKDVFLEDNTNKNSEPFLIVGKKPGFNAKRTVIQFESIPTNCNRVVRAKMYLYYYESSPAPSTLARTLQVHQLKKQWDETTATLNSPWSAGPRLNGIDAVPITMDTVNINAGTSINQYIEFDVTQAAQNWKSNSQSNHGVLIFATNDEVDGSDLFFHNKEHANNPPVLYVYCN